MSDENEEFWHNVITCFGKRGEARLIGTFEPVVGDIGKDVEGRLWVWQGQYWMDGKGKPAKTFEQWMGFA